MYRNTLQDIRPCSLTAMRSMWAAQHVNLALSVQPQHVIGTANKAVSSTLRQGPAIMTCSACKLSPACAVTQERQGRRGDGRRPSRAEQRLRSLFDAGDANSSELGAEVSFGRLLSSVQLVHSGSYARLRHMLCSARPLEIVTMCGLK